MGSQKQSEDSFKVSQSLIAQQFLEESASQLTYHGLCELTTSIKEGELAVFFRNNHFSAIYKEKSELFLLVTDQGFLKEPKVVWETLSSIDGDGHFVDEKFVTVVAPSGSAAAATTDANSICDTNPAALTSDQQIDIDHRLARRLAEEDEKRYERETAWENFKGGEQLSDAELAKKLHEEELESLAAAERHQQQQSGGSSSQGNPQSRHGASCHVSASDQAGAMQQAGQLHASNDSSRHQPGHAAATAQPGTSTAIASRQSSQRSK